VRWIVLVALCLAVPAYADDRPWAKGISDADQKTALALYDAGNKFFEESEYKEALEKYEEALAHWPHPAVYFNAAVCLYHLDQNIKAADYIDKALAYGPAPFDKKTFSQAKDYQGFLAARVTELEVKCTQPDVKITLDGETIMDHCPATATRRVNVKQDHAIVGEKPGYETAKIGPIRLEAGAKKTIEIILTPLPRGKVVRRWDRAVPWYVASAGGAVALAGFVPLYFANMHIDSYNRWVGQLCTMGCVPPDELNSLHGRGITDLHVADGMFIAGGVIAATGFTMILLNQPHLEKAPAVAPSIGPNHAGVVVFGRW
jgi:hypothetical protein